MKILEFIAEKGGVLLTDIELFPSLVRSLKTLTMIVLMAKNEKNRMSNGADT